MPEQPEGADAVASALISQFTAALDRLATQQQAPRETEATAAVLVEKFTEAVDRMAATQPPRDIQYHDQDYQQRMREEMVFFPRPVYQNGIEANPVGETPETLARTMDIEAGTYLGGVVTVLETKKGGIDFRYNASTPDRRMGNMRHFRDFAELVEKCAAESIRVHARQLARA